jgi:hypothetical protein
MKVARVARGAWGSAVIDRERMSSDIDIAYSRWISLLPSWRLSSSAPRSSSCVRCPSFLAALGLEGMMHEPVHALFCAVHAIIEDRFAEECLPDHYEGGWRLNIHPALDDRPAESAPRRAAQRTLYDDVIVSRRRAVLFDAAVAELTLRRTSMLEAVLAFVEPTVQRMADQLIAEICEPQ